MYLSPEILKKVEAQYGSPKVLRLAFEMTEREFLVLLKSMKENRAHDVTVFIVERDRMVVIRKPGHPPGVYRAPSGGLKPGEPFDEGVLRETYEETGLKVKLLRYILRVDVTFTHNGMAVEWTSHVFLARPLEGRLKPVDNKEISEVRWASIEEVRTSIQEALLKSGMGGLAYRAALTEASLEEILSNPVEAF